MNAAKLPNLSGSPSAKKGTFDSKPPLSCNIYPQCHTKLVRAVRDDPRDKHERVTIRHFQQSSTLGRLHPSTSPDFLQWLVHLLHQIPPTPVSHTMSTLLDLYEPLDVIGNGSFGIIRKVKRKSDSLVSRN